MRTCSLRALTSAPLSWFCCLHSAINSSNARHSVGRLASSADLSLAAANVRPIASLKACRSCSRASSASTRRAFSAPAALSRSASPFTSAWFSRASVPSISWAQEICSFRIATKLELISFIGSTRSAEQLAVEPDHAVRDRLIVDGVGARGDGGLDRADLVRVDGRRGSNDLLELREQQR